LPRVSEKLYVQTKVAVLTPTSGNDHGPGTKDMAVGPVPVLVVVAVVLTEAAAITGELSNGIIRNRTMQRNVPILNTFFLFI
jgi:hypothetical protein